MAIEGQVQDLLGRIGKALNGLLELRIETAIAPMGIDKPADGEGRWSLVPKPGDNGVEGVTTLIRLEQGDIQNAMSEGALANNKLMEIHNQQVALSRDIVANNIKALVEIAQSLLK